MSKKTKKAAARMGGRTTPITTRANRATAGARVYHAPKPEVNLTAVRIVGGVLAVLLIGLAIYAGLNPLDGVSTGVLVALMVLAGILAGLGLMAAIKPENVAGWFEKLK